VKRLVFVGFGCNNRCLVCAQGDLRSTATEPNVGPRGLAQIETGDIAAIVGGEPTIANDLPDWIRALDACGAARVLLQTNGRRLSYAAYARALAACSKRLALDVSLLGSNAAMHDYHTRAPGSFVETARGIRHARAAGIPVAMTTVVTRSNYRHLTEIVALAAALGVDAIRFADLVPLGTAESLLPSLAPTQELVAPHLARAGVLARTRRLRVADEHALQDDDRFAGLGVTADPHR